MTIQERTERRDQLLAKLESKGFSAQAVTVTNAFETYGDDVPGIMVSHDYNGLYPTSETWTTFYAVQRLARAAGFNSEARGFYTATLIR